MSRVPLLALVLAACAPEAPARPASAPVPPVGAPSPERFAADLRTRLVGWYHLHADDAVDGNDLDAALDAVDVALVERLSAPEDDPFARDLALVAVYRHPDVVWPGSDRAWFGAYRLDDGELLGVDDFE